MSSPRMIFPAALFLLAMAAAASAQEIVIEPRVITGDEGWYLVLDVEVDGLDDVDEETAEQIRELERRLEAWRQRLSWSHRQGLQNGETIRLSMIPEAEGLDRLDVGPLALEVRLPTEDVEPVIRVVSGGGDVGVMHAYQPFRVEVLIPRHLADEHGDEIEVTVTTAAGRSTSLTLTSRANGRGAIIYGHDLEATLGGGAYDNAIGPLPLWDMKTLKTENGETVTFSAAGATTDVVVYDHAGQMRTALVVESMLQLDAILERLLAEDGLSAKDIAVLGAKRALIANALQVHDREGLSAIAKDRILQAYAGLLESDPATWTATRAGIRQLGIVAHSVEEQRAVAEAIGDAVAAHGDVLWRGASIMAEAGYDLITNITGVNQLHIVIFGIDNRGNRVDMTHRVLAGIELGSMAAGGVLILEARMTSAAGGLTGGGGGLVPRGAAARGGRRPTQRLRPEDILGDFETFADAPRGRRIPDGPEVPSPGAGADTLLDDVPAAAGRHDGSTEAGLLRAPGAGAPPRVRLSREYDGPMDLYGLPDRPWARERVNRVLRRIDGDDRMDVAAAFRELDALIACGNHLRSRGAAQRVRMERAMAILEKLNDLDEYRGTINWQSAWDVVSLQSVLDLFPGDLASHAIPFAHSGGRLTAAMFAEAAGVSEVTAASWLRKAAARAGLKPENMARIELEIPPSPLTRAPGWRIRWNR